MLKKRLRLHIAPAAAAAYGSFNREGGMEKKNWKKRNNHVRQHNQN